MKISGSVSDTAKVGDSSQVSLLRPTSAPCHTCPAGEATRDHTASSVPPVAQTGNGVSTSSRDELCGAMSALKSVRRKVSKPSSQPPGVSRRSLSVCGRCSARASSTPIGIAATKVAKGAIAGNTR